MCWRINVGLHVKPIIYFKPYSRAVTGVIFDTTRTDNMQHNTGKPFYIHQPRGRKIKMCVMRCYDDLCPFSILFLISFWHHVWHSLVLLTTPDAQIASERAPQERRVRRGLAHGSQTKRPLDGSAQPGQKGSKGGRARAPTRPSPSIARGPHRLHLRKHGLDGRDLVAAQVRVPEVEEQHDA